MKLLVAPHELTIGGSQINAIDLAAGAADAGHDVVVYGVPGPLVDYVEERGVTFVPARRLRYRPALSRIAQLAGLARQLDLDLIHAYEWPPCLDAYYGAHVALRVPLVCTVLSMSVSPLVPSSVPLIMGTEALSAEARRRQRAEVWTLEPPIDTVADHPGIDGAEFRRSRGVGEEELLVVTVSRLAIDLKLDALVRAIDAVDLLAARLPVRLEIVGGGPAGDALRDRGEAVNERWGREVVGFSGPLMDPRAAYASADVVVGMGSSALRAMAVGRPVVVQGEEGFSKTFAPETQDYFLHHGFWGRGDAASTSGPLAHQLAALLEDRDARERLGAFGRGAVEDRFSLRRGVIRQLEIYEQVLGARAHGRRSGRDAIDAAGRSLALEVRAHDPRRKRVRRETELAVLRAAGRVRESAAHA
jgi:glycosyltransferase involved in cell wall biosynthesis